MSNLVRAIPYVLRTLSELISVDANFETCLIHGILISRKSPKVVCGKFEAVKVTFIESQKSMATTLVPVQDLNLEAVVNTLSKYEKAPEGAFC
jgi:hypothetical protein